jgi:hypothetical protein
MKNKTKRITLLILIISIIGILILGGVSTFLTVGNQREYIITDIIVQTELENEETEKGYKYSTKYLYFCTTDKGKEIVFQNEDNFILGKFNSSDILAKLKKYEENGKPFKIKTAGFRIRIFSFYQNIIKVEEI